MREICEDLKQEQQELDAAVAGLDEKRWLRETPSPGWNIKMQICHLVYFDERAALAAADAGKFQEHLQELFSDPGKFFETLDAFGQDLSAAELLNRWRQGRRALLEAYASMNPKARLLWYGPPMSALSHATARLMETWAHGQDVFDTLGIRRAGSDRLRHIAHLGVTTRAWSYQNRGLSAPETPVFVALTAPSGALWQWGPEDAADKITGPAPDFCLVVAQRRHVDDTALKVTGSGAYDWMLKAQCFAGPPTDGPRPGER